MNKTQDKTIALLDAFSGVLREVPARPPCPDAPPYEAIMDILDVAELFAKDMYNVDRVLDQIRLVRAWLAGVPE